MNIVKPFYVCSQQNRKDPTIKGIYSVDIHPNGTKYATSGGNDKNGLINIWNMEALRDKSVEQNENIPKLLFSDNSHLKCVNVVRWSPNGKYLASGSVDSLIFIWVQRKLNEIDKNKYHENYRTAFQLRGHKNDVIDLAWCKSGCYLASCGIDDKIIIWNVDKLPEKLISLYGHESFVKGVSWDPLGRYLASLSEDKTVRIWRTSDWKVETVLDGQLDANLVNCTFSRLSWSPDGMNLIVPGTTNNNAHTCQLYSRDNWTKGLDMIGHTQSLLCAKFMPSLLKHPKTGSHFIIIAMGGKDRSLSIWATFKNRPLHVISNLFLDTIFDISWNPEHLEMMICSLDGNVVYIKLDSSVFGNALSESDMSEYLADTYGREMMLSNNYLCARPDSSSVSGLGTNGVGGKFVIPESSAALQLQMKQNQVRSSYGPKTDLTGLSNQGQRPSGPSHQIIHKTNCGKRRITPKFLNHIDEDDLDAVVADSTSTSNTAPASLASSSSSVKSTPTRSSEVTPSKTQQVASSSDQSSTASISESKPDPIKHEPKPDPIKHEPKPDPSPSRVNPPTPSPLNADSAKHEPKPDPSPSRVNPPTPSPLNMDPTKHQQLLKKLQPSTAGFKDLDISNTASSSTAVSLVSSTPTVGSVVVNSAAEILTGPLMDSPKKSSIKVIGPARPGPLLHPMKVPSILSNTALLCIHQATSYMLRITHDSTNKHSTITVLIHDKQIWTQSLSLIINIIIHFKDTIYAGDVKGQLHIFNLPSGQRTQLPMNLDGSPLASISCDNRYVFVVTATAHLFVFTSTSSTSGMTAITSTASLSPPHLSLMIHSEFSHLLAPNTNQSVKSINLVHQDNLTLSLESGQSFLLNRQLVAASSCSMAGLWQPINSLLNPTEVWISNHYGNLQNSSQPLACLQSPISQAVELVGPPKSVRSSLTSDHLQRQILLSKSLNSPSEYKYWLLLWLRLLIEEGDQRDTVRDVCLDLLGPVNCSAKSSWQPYIMGVSKREILKEVLELFALNLQLQSIYTQIKDQMDSVTNEHEHLPTVAMELGTVTMVE